MDKEAFKKELRRLIEAALEDFDDIDYDFETYWEAVSNKVESDAVEPSDEAEDEEDSFG